MKAHEETWTADRHPDEAGDLFVADEHGVVLLRVLDAGRSGDTSARARLAAQAPAMARLLLKLQESGCTTGAAYSGCDPACPSCSYSEGHAPDCELATVLRAAGVLP